MENVKVLRRILRCFYLVSGLKINLNKSWLFATNVEEPERVIVANMLGCKTRTFPFKYLGLQVGANMNLVKSWDPVVDLFRKRLSLWKAKKLSFGGRLTVIKSVLNSLPTYYFSLYKASVGALEKLDRIRRVFFWGGSEEEMKINWVA